MILSSSNAVAVLELQQSGFGTVAPTVAWSLARTTSVGRRARCLSTAHVPTAGKQEQKGLFDTIFDTLYREEQMLETNPILNKVGSKSKPPLSSLLRRPRKPPKRAAVAGSAWAGSSPGPRKGERYVAPSENFFVLFLLSCFACNPRIGSESLGLKWTVRHHTCCCIYSAG
jgi:hypothetical protein